VELLEIQLFVKVITSVEGIIQVVLETMLRVFL
jgi:hypothetical protein